MTVPTLDPRTKRDRTSRHHIGKNFSNDSQTSTILLFLPPALSEIGSWFQRISVGTRDHRIAAEARIAAIWAAT
jgi:hypothetical protein